ncbi:MAG: SCP2 sterol-binding domain-containing protein [Chloroflexi bacterium]|nr:SCP2 sterol-binding domain-containing protein [Chloroflexota bacterium]
MTTPAEIFASMPDKLDASKAGDINMAVVFSLSGDNGGDWTVKVADGKASVDDGAAEGANATVKMDAGDYADMMSGKLNPMMAFMSGKVKVDGDLNSVMKLQSLFGM